jgi:hypothetical protein
MLPVTGIEEFAVNNALVMRPEVNNSEVLEGGGTIRSSDVSGGLLAPRSPSVTLHLSFERPAPSPRWILDSDTIVYPGDSIHHRGWRRRAGQKWARLKHMRKHRRLTSSLI